MANKEEVLKLKEIARNLRIDVVKMLHKSQSGHTGGSLGQMDMMVGMYFHAMNYDVKNPLWEDRDRFILSCGHCCPALYACLAHAGFFPKEKLDTLRQLGSDLQGHPKKNPELGIEMSSGSLGQGMGLANGIALAARVKGKNYKVYSMQSDGESQSGVLWEGAMLAAHYKLDNRIAMLDYNGIQIDGFTKDIMEVDPLREKFQAFGWNVLVIDGNDMAEVIDALDVAKDHKGVPTIILGRTLLGKGVSIFENKPQYHGVAPSDEEFEVALKELASGQ